MVKRAGIVAPACVLLTLSCTAGRLEATMPPPALHECVVGPYIVFFEAGTARLSPETVSILERAIVEHHNCDPGNAVWKIDGFADRTGEPAYNLLLAQRRADAVRAYLSAHEITDTRISTRALGENTTYLRVTTADGVAEPENRRVEITLAPGD